MSIFGSLFLLASDLREIVSCMYVIEELERIGDYAEGIAVLTIKIGVRPFCQLI